MTVEQGSPLFMQIMQHPIRGVDRMTMDILQIDKSVGQVVHALLKHHPSLQEILASNEPIARFKQRRAEEAAILTSSSAVASFMDAHPQRFGGWLQQAHAVSHLEDLFHTLKWTASTERVDEHLVEAFLDEKIEYTDPKLGIKTKHELMKLFQL